ncbi:MAG: hypothetical protein RIR18_1609 [Pseudomonadota bacterium]|jgi:cell wall-associated NlpC family hydrolase
MNWKNWKPTFCLALAASLQLTACNSLFSQHTPSESSQQPSTSVGVHTEKSIPSTVMRKTGNQEGRLTNQRQDVLMYTMGLLGTGYRFGGKNPEAGLDCSGMVSFIYREATNYPLRGNAASMAIEGRQVGLKEVLPGDLVFFNTQQRPHSHVGIFIGEGRFVHAPSTNNKIRVDRLDTGYFAKRFEEARTYFN